MAGSAGRGSPIRVHNMLRGSRTAPASYLARSVGRKSIGQIVSSMPFIRKRAGPSRSSIARRGSGHASGRRRLRRRESVVEAGLLLVERGPHDENRLALLTGDDPARRETAAVAKPLDLEQDRLVRIAAEEEIGVQRVGVAAPRRCARRRQAPAPAPARRTPAASRFAANGRQIDPPPPARGRTKRRVRQRSWACGSVSRGSV